MKKKIGPIARGVLAMVLLLVGLASFPLGCWLTFVMLPLHAHGTTPGIDPLVYAPLALGILMAAGCVAGVVFLLRARTKPKILRAFLFVSALVLICLMGAILAAPSVRVRISCRDGDCDFREANLSGANLSRADLSGANLIDAEITDEQLAQAATLKGATLPDGTVHE